MKNVLTCAIIFVASQFVNSCKSNEKISLQRVKDAQYQIYTFNEEKGYRVRFKVCGKGIEPSAVVINRVRSDYDISNRKKDIYDIDVIFNTTKIMGFKPQISNHKNGVIYKNGDIEKFVPINFTLVQKFE